MQRISKQSRYVRCPALELLWNSLCGPLRKKFGDPWCTRTMCNNIGQEVKTQLLTSCLELWCSHIDLTGLHESLGHPVLLGFGTSFAVNLYFLMEDVRHKCVRCRDRASGWTCPFNFCTVGTQYLLSPDCFVIKNNVVAQK